MGCSPGDRACQDDEFPRHTVRITKGFEMGKYEVTQAQWKAIMGRYASRFWGPDQPVDRIGWDKAQQFLEALNAVSGDAHHYRLPTEAEWEYAARAGTSGDRYGRLWNIAWYLDNSEQTTHRVGSLEPNAWGLYDMLGNVWELCADWKSDRYADASPVDDPTGAPSGEHSVMRGGAWIFGRKSARVSNRATSSTSQEIGFDGFRLVRTQTESK